MNDTPNENTPPSRWRRRVGRTFRLARWTLYAALAAGALLVFTPAGDWLGDRLIRLDPIEPGDCIVVLGGDIDRAVEAARLYRDGLAPKVIVSSRGRDVDHYVYVLRTFGVPEAAILLDRAATRTADHPATVAALPGIDRQTTRLIVVTSLYHTSRARACFVHGGYKHVVMRAPAVQIYQHDEMPPNWASRYRHLPGWGRELAGWGAYKLFGRL